MGFPEWWEDGHKLNRNSTGKGRMAVGREEGVGSVAPTGSQGATLSGNNGGESMEISTGGGWWGVNGGGINTEREAAGGSASFTKAIEGKGFEGLPSNPSTFPFYKPAPTFFHDSSHIYQKSHDDPNTKIKCHSTPISIQN